jgi:alkylation response protein AidB-like acyl-CoA dehydrogenase
VTNLPLYNSGQDCHASGVDFSLVELSEEDREFQDGLREFLGEIVTEEVLRSDRETGQNFDEGVHLALGANGYLAGDYNTLSDGGFSAVRRRIFDLEVGRAHTPWFHWGTTAQVAKMVEQFGRPDVTADVLPGVLDGRIRLCLGYTEPDGGSDVATCKTRAVRDGDHWVINGAKMFTSNAHNAQYVFLLTNTDPQAPKHKSLTMFLVPLDTPGIEIQGIRTVDGDRTNIVYYSDVRVSDRFRVGEVNGGWTVMRQALDAEHGVGERGAQGLQRLCTMTEHGLLMAEAVDTVAGIVGRDGADGRRRIDDDSVAYRLGRSIARMEAALSTADMYGRVAIAATMREISPDLMDVLGSAGSLPVETDGSADDGAAEYLFRLAGPMGVYGGTLEIFRNMIAQHRLGLGRPNYSPPTGSSA